MPYSSPDADQPLPDNLDAERFVLGMLLSQPEAWLRVAPLLSATDFSIEKHKRIFLRMGELAERGEPIDRITVANELQKRGQLQGVDGLSYLVSLDDGLPPFADVEAHARIVREKSHQRGIIHLCQQAIDSALIGEKEPSLIAVDIASRLADIAERDIDGDGLLSVEQIALAAGPAHLLDPGNPAHARKGLPTGFLKLDDMTGGLREGELFILAARPAMGKTALALNMAYNVATHRKTPKAVAIFSFEMSKESLLSRLLCASAMVDQLRYRSGYLNSQERYLLQHAMNSLTEAPLFIDDTAGTTLVDVHGKLRKLQAEHDLGLVVIDYLQLMQGRGRFENRVQEISSLSRGFKLLSKELKVPFLVLSQLSRAPETRPGDHRPMLSDLRESGSIEQDADQVAFIFREEVYRPDKESLKGKAELILAKQRNGPTGRIHLAYLNRFTKFENLAADTGEEESGWKPQPPPDDLFPTPFDDDPGEGEFVQ